MALRSFPSQLWLTIALGTTSALSVFWILRDDDLPGTVSERSVASDDNIHQLSSDMEAMFAGFKDWRALCEQPLQSILESRAELDGSTIRGQALPAESNPTFLGQLERDALHRCLGRGSEGRFCFYTAKDGEEPSQLFEVHVEFRQGRRQLSCQELNPIPADTELMAFYTAYQGQVSGRALRISSGLRVRAQAH